jgi:hypothetical protein
VRLHSPEPRTPNRVARSRIVGKEWILWAEGNGNGKGNGDGDGDGEGNMERGAERMGNNDDDPVFPLPDAVSFVFQPSPSPSPSRVLGWVLSSVFLLLSSAFRSLRAPSFSVIHDEQ